MSQTTGNGPAEPDPYGEVDPYADPDPYAAPDGPDEHLAAQDELESHTDSGVDDGSGSDSLVESGPASADEYGDAEGWGVEDLHNLGF